MRDELGRFCVYFGVITYAQSISGHARSIAREGSTTLFEELYQQHQTDVFRYALVLTRSRQDAEDIAAETFARALGAWNRGREPNKAPLAWLLAITRNLARDRWRRAQRVVRSFASSRNDAQLDRVESLLWLDAISRILPARQREVVSLRYHRDLSDADIGQIMGLSESGVRSLVARAITTLREHPEVWQ